jgi:hypothetical protein
MDIFFQDPSEVPLPPQEVRIRDLRAEAWPDGQRVHVSLEVDPFQKRPSLELVIKNAGNETRASASILETMVRKMELTMHLRGAPAAGEYTLAATLFYSQTQEPDSEESGELPERQIEIIDRAETTFHVEAKEP